MAKIYLSLNFTDGKLYQRSKTEKEGYEKHVTEREGKEYVSYRKYLDGKLEGTFEGIKKRESDFGDEIQVVFSKDGDQYFMPVKIYDGRNQIDDTYLIPFIQVLPNMEVGSDYEVFPYRFKPDDSKYFKSGISVKKDGEKVEWALSREFITKDGEVTKGDIPALVFKEDKLAGKMKPTASSIEERDEYLKEAIIKLLEVKAISSSEGSTETEDTSTKEKESAPKKEEPKAKEEAPKKEKKRQLPF